MAAREVDLGVAPYTVDREVRAMARIVAALEPLDEHVRRRILRYLLDRYAYAPPAAAGGGNKPPPCASPLVTGGLCALPYGHAGSHDRGRYNPSL